ncbi:MAG: nitronate monooxygenase [Magnetococcales bacterium]|nr:nitronate monooxygenase [Magnetococcales bacterium]
MQSVLQNSWQQGVEFLQTKYPILGGAMSWLSEHNLVSAISEAGGFGVLAAGSMSADLLRQEVRKTFEKTDKPFGVNLITMHPDLADLVNVVVEEKVSHCVFAGGFPDAATVRVLKDANIKVMLFAPSLALGKRLIKRGADALIIEGHEAGGHVGPVATTVLMQEILPHIKDVPVFVAGGISNGDLVAGALELGAAGCQIGTRFVCVDECIAHDNFKKAFIRAQARSAVVTAQFDPALPVIPVRALANEGTVAFNTLQLSLVKQVKAGEKDRKDALMELEHFWVGALRNAAIDGDVKNGSVMAGQCVGMVNKVQPVAEVIEELVSVARQRMEA